MNDAAKLLTAIAAILGSIAWPAVVLIIFVLFKSDLRAIAVQLPSVIGRISKMKFAGVEAELERVADSSANSATGKITAEQVKSAEKLKTFAPSHSAELLRQLDDLCREYDSIRRTMSSGFHRTQAMTRVVAKMRVLAPSLLHQIDIYKGSGSAGSRLAAVAMMQMAPSASDLNWLVERFRGDQPFIFYHAALALENLASVSLPPDARERLIGAAEQSLSTLLSFKGEPDPETVSILKGLIIDLKG